MKSMICAMLSFLLFTTTMAIASPADVQSVIKKKMDAAILVLQTTDLTQKAKKDKIQEIIIPIFDMTLMAKLSVGKKYWSGFSTTQKKQFVDAFNHRLQNSYLDTIMEYSNEELVYGTPVQAKKKVYVPLELVSSDSKVDMIYKLYTSKGAWKIYDVEIEGVSIIKSYRSQISEILSKSTFDDLMIKFEKVSN